MFMQIAIGAIGVAVVLMVGYLVIAQVKGSLMGSTILKANTSEARNITKSMSTMQNTIFAGFGLLAVGIIVLAAFGIISVFNK